MSEWTYEVNVNNYIWRGDLVGSKEEAIRIGSKEAKEEGYDNFKIGIAEKAEEKDINIDMIIEDLQESYYDEFGELAEDYLDHIAEKDKKDLKRVLNNAFWKWAKERDYTPNFWNIHNEEVIKVKQVEDGLLQTLLEEKDKNK